MCEREATIIGEPHEACLGPPTEPATYKHQPLMRSLNEIRLLKLRKEKHGPVHCDVEVFPLEKAPKYIALSYRWGPPLPLHNIFIGVETLQIRDILNSCLLELREDVDTWLWIDQICIAQSDTAERNHQVGMMSRIYSTSASLIAWLGDVPLARPGKIDRFNDRRLDPASIVVLLGNNYFTRLWIVQEMLLSKNVILCLNGKRCVGWSRLYAVCNESYKQQTWSVFGSVSITASGLIEHARDPGDLLPQLTWMECIRKFSANTCEDARDKVYGMMGIVREEDRFTVDYNKSVLEVFLDVVNMIKNVPLKTLKECLHILGVRMGIDWSLIQDLGHLAQERLEKSLREAVSPIRFKKADNEEERDHWWYECNGKESCYPRPPSASPAAPSKHTSGTSRRILQRPLRRFAKPSYRFPSTKIRNRGSRVMSAESTVSEV